MGFDCIGLVLHAYAISDVALPRYRLSDGDWPSIEAALQIWFDRVRIGSATCDDLVVCRLPRCFHFAVLTDSSTIHADLRLGRVAERPLAEAWPAQTRIYRKLRVG